MTRIIHTGDTHLGYRQYHSPERRADFLAAFESVVDDAVELRSTGSQDSPGDAVESDIDAVVHAGDLFHDRTPSLEDLMGTIEILRELADAGIPFLAVVGNHEGTRSAQWLDLLESLDLAERLGDEPRVVGDTAFYGQDYAPEAEREGLEYDFAPHDADCAALVSHGAFTPFAHASWDTESILDASPVEFDAVLLGDNHHPDRAEVGGTLVTYCGSTERASAAEREARGYNVVRFGADAESGAVRLSRRGIETRPFVFLDLELDAGEGEAFVRERLREESLDGAVVVVTLTGAGERVPPAEIERFGKDRGALVVRVNDRREVEETDEGVGVSFADPDDAVRDRVREMGLSEAARAVDEAVRGGELADANVRDAVEAEVRELVEEDLSAFESAANGNGAENEAEPNDEGGDAPESRDDPVESDGDGQVTMGEF